MKTITGAGSGSTYSNTGDVPYEAEACLHPLTWIRLFRKVFNSLDYLKNAIETLITGDITLGTGASTITVPGLLDAQGNVNLGNTTGDLVSIQGTTQIDGPARTKNLQLGTTAGTTGDAATIVGDLVMGGGRIVEDIIDTGDNDLSGQTYHRFFVFRGVTQPRYLAVTIPDPRAGTAFFVNSSSVISNASVSLTINGVGSGQVQAQTRMFYYNGSSWLNIEL